MEGSAQTCLVPKESLVNVVHLGVATRGHDDIIFYCLVIMCLYKNDISSCMISC